MACKWVPLTPRISFLSHPCHRCCWPENQNPRALPQRREARPRRSSGLWVVPGPLGYQGIVSGVCVILILNHHLSSRLLSFSGRRSKVVCILSIHERHNTLKTEDIEIFSEPLMCGFGNYYHFCLCGSVFFSVSTARGNLSTRWGKHCLPCMGV